MSLRRLAPPDMQPAGFAFTSELFQREYEVRERLNALADTREAAQAFIERRPPRFIGA